MKILAVRIQNLLSYDSFEWRDIDEGLNLIVGPNGAGKTNLIHAFRLVRDALDGSRGRRARWERAERNVRRGGTPGFKLSLDVRFDASAERELLTSFVIAGMCDRSAAPGLPIAPARFAEYIQDHMQRENIDWLFEGRWTVSHEGASHWQIDYESLPDAALPFSFAIEGAAASVMRVTRPQNPNAYEGYLYAWRVALGADVHKLDDFFSTPTSAAPPFFGFRDSVEASESGICLTVTRPYEGSDRIVTHRTFEAKSGRRLGDSTLGASFVFGTLFERGTFFIENVRQPPRLTYTTTDLTRSDIDPSDGRDLILLLIQDKNGPRLARDRYSHTQRLFETLTGRTVDVGVAFAATDSSEDQAPLGIELSAMVSDGDSEVPLEFSGAGRTEALFLSYALATSTDKILFLDEPASNLHPNVQRVLLQSVRDEHGHDQCLLVTHSPNMVASDHLEAITRLSRERGATRRSSLGVTDKSELTAIEKIFRQSSDAAALLFARAVLLMEGATELGAIPIWYEKERQKSFNEHGIAIYPVDGHEAFKWPALFLGKFGIPWAIVCDGPIFTQGKRGMAAQLIKAGVSDVPSIEGMSFSQTVEALSAVGVFTTASHDHAEFEDIEEVRAIWDEAKRELDTKSKVRIGRWIAEQIACPPAVKALLHKIDAYLEGKSALH